MHNLNILIMTKEMKAFIRLVISLITFILLLPFTLVIITLKITKSILTIIENTITFFIDSIRKELLK